MGTPIPAVNPHGALLTIDTGAIASNWQFLSGLGRGAECAAVIKADAYGLGIEPVAQALARVGCRTFFVAHVQEGVAARRAAPLAHIYVLNGLPPGSEPIYQTHRLRPVLGSVGDIARWHKAGAGPAALHVDTGMNRLGLSAEEAKTLSQSGSWKHLGFDLVLSHFVSSEIADDPLNAAQIARFDRIASLFSDGIRRRSLANSSAHFLDTLPHYEMTRAGYALFGGNPVPGAPNPMKPAVTLEAPILQIRQIETGETVGYNGQWTAKRPSRIAVLSVGYADGWLRSLSGTDARPGASVLIDGHACPAAGRVSMDLLTFDVTECDPDKTRPGTKATLIGGPLTIDAVADVAGTNGYEILTSLGSRYQRRYL
jgi:alanine racemase